jgi:hypothetical protein
VGSTLTCTTTFIFLEVRFYFWVPATAHEKDCIV